MLTWRDIWVYVRMLIRWWWVLAICVGLSTGIAYMVARTQPDFYQARAVLMVGDNFSAATPDQYAFGLSNTLAQFYAVMARREAILQPVVDRLGLNFGWELLNEQIFASVNSQASLLEIWVTDTDPDRAAAIAGAIGDELIKFSPNSPEKIAEQRTVFEQQSQEAEQNLKNVEARLKELQARQSTLVSAVDLRNIDEQIAELQKVRDRYQETYNQLVQLRNSTTVNSLSIFEAPTRPQYALPSKRLLTVAAAGAGGCVLALLAIILLEALDDRWRSGRDLRNRFGLNDLGLVPVGPPLGSSDDPEVEKRREQSVRDAHTRILLAALERGTRLLLVTSPEPNESRSAFVVDMARLFTRSGYRVLLVDADMAEPYLTGLVGGGEQGVRPVVVHSADIKVWSHLQQTAIENVMLLGRHTSPDGKPMTPSLPWPDLVQSLNRAADVVIFDGPSTLSSADAALLAPLVDGIVLALDPSINRRGAVLESKHRLMRRRGANLLGAVVLEPAARGKGWRRRPNSPTLPPARQIAAASAEPAASATATSNVGEGEAAPQSERLAATPGLSSAMAEAIGRGLLLPPGSSNPETVLETASDILTLNNNQAAPVEEPVRSEPPAAAHGRKRRQNGAGQRPRSERVLDD